MTKIPRKITLPKCNDDPAELGKHDFKTEWDDYQARKWLSKKEKRLWKRGWKRCWYCGVWINYREYLKVKKIRKRLIRKWGMDKFKRRERRQNA